MSSEPQISDNSGENWTLAGRELKSRLIVGTGKYKDGPETKACLEASGAEIVTVALRRVDLKAKDNLLSWIDRDRYTLLPNTAGCYTAEEAVRTAALGARSSGSATWLSSRSSAIEKTLLSRCQRADNRSRAQVLGSTDGFDRAALLSADDPVTCLKAARDRLRRR